MHVSTLQKFLGLLTANSPKHMTLYCQSKRQQMDKIRLLIHQQERYCASDHRIIGLQQNVDILISSWH